MGKIILMKKFHSVAILMEDNSNSVTTGCNLLLDYMRRLNKNDGVTVPSFLFSLQNI